MIGESAKDEALRFLAARMRSEEEVRQNLRKKGYTIQEIQLVIDWLYEYAFLDDESFCAAYIRDKIRFHPCGPLKLAYELRQKGIAAATIDRILPKVYPYEIEIKVAYRFYVKQLKRGRSTLQAKRYLSGKGFDGETVAVVNEMVSEHLDI